MSSFSPEIIHALEQMIEVENGQKNNNFYVSIFHQGWLQRSDEHYDIAAETLDEAVKRGLAERRGDTLLYRLTLLGRALLIARVANAQLANGRQATSQPAKPDLRERLSDVSHDIWSHWMRWMFTVGTFNEDGTWTMPAALVVRWQGQMETLYSQLSEREKDSDREQADKIMLAMGDE